MLLGMCVTSDITQPPPHQKDKFFLISALQNAGHLEDLSL